MYQTYTKPAGKDGFYCLMVASTLDNCLYTITHTSDVKRLVEQRSIELPQLTCRGQLRDHRLPH
jgi:hypothetical protein